MWMELINIFRGADPTQQIGKLFLQMLAVTHDMAKAVEPHIFDHSLTFEERSAIYKLDVKVNKLERTIRKRVVARLVAESAQTVYCLLLMMLSKDAERIGDYIKNISEVSELGGSPLPDSPLRAELADIVQVTMEIFAAAGAVVEEQDQDRATELLQMGRHAGKRCDRLLVQLAASDMTPPQVTSMVLLTRFYKRVGAHLFNILSSVVMPLHKVDFFDERKVRDRAG